MRILFATAKRVVQFVLLLVFLVLLGDWAIILVYTVGKLIAGGIPSVQLWYLHIMLRHDEMFRDSFPGWGTVGLRFGELAVVTVVLGLANYRTLRNLWRLVRQWADFSGRPNKQDLETARGPDSQR
jgi:hypothetical protein